MKKISVLLLLLLFTAQVFSQDDNGVAISTAKNEFKINGLFIILGAIEIDYEYLINEEASLGVDVLFAFDDENLDLNYYVSPYYRQYFGKKPTAGFFVEGFGMLNSVDDFVFTEEQDSDGFPIFDGEFQTVTDFALGIGAGGKFLTKRGFVAEISVGIGRNLFNSDRDYTIVGKGGISLGYRF